MTERYPLSWPFGWPRTPSHQRKRAKFSRGERIYHQTGGSYTSKRDLTMADALKRLTAELDRLGARDLVLSTNVQVRLDGLPYSNRAEPADPGAALYFKLKGKPIALACDRFDRVADNVAALAAHIDATRAIERYGVGSLERAFAGYEALPSPEMQRPWREVLEMHHVGQPTAELVDQAYRRLARERHPDRGGSDAMMANLNVARYRAMRELGA